MAIRIPYCIDGQGTLILILEGRSYSIVKDNQHFNTILNLVRRGEVGLLAARLANHPLARQSASYANGIVYLNGQPIAPALSELYSRIAISGRDTGGWLKFVERVHQNVSPYVQEHLFRFIVHMDLTVNDEGEILAFKSVDKHENGDYTDHHTHSWKYEVGKTYVMSRELVDTSSGSCGAGLHIGTTGYISDVYPGDAVLRVKVAPEDVVSVPSDYSSQKCRCCRFTVLELLTYEEALAAAKVVNGSDEEEVLVEAEEEEAELEIDDDWDDDEEEEDSELEEEEEDSELEDEDDVEDDDRPSDPDDGYDSSGNPRE